MLVADGISGTAKANLQRWKDMFVPPAGKKIEDVATVKEMKVGDDDASYLDVHGTYKYKNPPFAPNAKEERKENFRRIGVIFETDKGPYFITLTGPANTVAKSKEGFDGWIKAFK